MADAAGPVDAETAEPSPPDDWSHRHPHLSTLLVALAGGALIGAALALSSSAGTIALGAAVTAAVVFVLAEVLSLVLRIPVVPAILTGHPVAEYRYLGPSGGEGPYTMGGGWGGDGGGGGGGDGGDGG